MRRSGNRISVTAQLIDAETASHIWAERYDRSVVEVFTVQDDITHAVTAAILPVVTDAEQRRAMRKLPEGLGAWEAYQRGLWHLARPTASNFKQSQQYFRQAIEADPMFVPPYYRLAHLLIVECAVYHGQTVEETVSLASRWSSAPSNSTRMTPMHTPSHPAYRLGAVTGPARWPVLNWPWA